MGEGCKDRISVFGGGLIGGSICLALKQRRPSTELICVELPERIPSVVDAGIGDRVCTLDECAGDIASSSTVVLAAPVEEILTLLDRLSPHFRPGTVVTDVGGTKAEIVRKARETLPPGVHFVGGHPIAGSERSGPSAADPLLFRGRIYMLCPAPETPPDALLSMIAFAEDLLAVPFTIEAEEHDRVMAMLSHAPQLVAVALMHAALEDDVAHGLLETIAGPGFLGLTRIAASEFPVWRSVLETNRKPLCEALSRIEASLKAVRHALDVGGLEVLWEKVGGRRRKMGLDALPRARKDDLRHLIDGTDERILKELGNRLRVVRRMGKLKRDQEAQVEDGDRERRALEDRKLWGRTVGLTPELVEDLFGVIFHHSKRMQSLTPVERES